MKTPRILILIYGGVVQTTAADPNHIEVRVLDFDNTEDYELPEDWRPLAQTIFGNEIPEQVKFLTPT